MATKQANLTIGERFAALKILNAEKVGDLSLLAKFLDDAKKLNSTPAEWDEAKLIKTAQIGEDGKPNGVENWAWTEEGSEKDVELDSDTVLAILNSIKDKETKKEITMADAVLITLKAKLS